MGREILTGVEEAGVLAIKSLDVLVDDAVLVRGAREVRAESTAGGVEAVFSAIRSDTRAAVSWKLGLELHGGTDGGHEWAAGREGGQESAGVLAIVGQASTVIQATETTVTAGAEQGNTTGTELGEGAAHTLGVGFGDGLLVIAIRAADDLGQILLVHDIVDPGEVGLVSVGWGVEIRDERRASSSREGDGRLGPGHAQDGLGIEDGLLRDVITVCLLNGQGGILSGRAVGNLNRLEGIRMDGGRWVVSDQELIDIRSDGGLVEIVIPSDLSTADGLLLVAQGAIQGVEAIQGHRGDVADLGNGLVGRGLVSGRSPAFLKLNPVGLLGRGAHERVGGLDGVDEVV